MKVWHPVSSAVGMVESLRSRSSTVLLTIYLRPCIYALAFRVNHLPDSTLLPHVLLPADTESHCSTCRDTYLNCNCISSCVGGAGCVPMCTGFPVTLHPIESIAGWGGAPWPVCGSQKTDSCQGLALTSHLLRQALPVSAVGWMENVCTALLALPPTSQGSAGLRRLLATTPAFLHELQKLNSGSQA